MARGLALDAIAPWRDAVTPWLAGDTASLPILDGGAGTGQFTAAFRAWLDRDVIALEPAAAMRRTARSLLADDPRQRWLAGRLEDLPLASSCCGAAWLSTVVHHVTDLARCARELRRVLVPGAPILVRGAFPGRHDGITLLRENNMPPVVSITSPVNGANVSQLMAAFTTAASDPDGGVLRASVLYAADGRTFVPLASRLRARRLVAIGLGVAFRAETVSPSALLAVAIITVAVLFMSLAKQPGHT